VQTLMFDPVAVVPVRRRGGFRRIATFVAVVALLGAALVIARDAGTPTVRDQGTAVTQVAVDEVAELGAPANLQGQIVDVAALIRAIVCPILARLAAAIPFAGGIIASLLVRFGCISP
jgi:hypothetical protein